MNLWRKNKDKPFLLLAILILGLFLRFYLLPDSAMFVGDQGRDYLVARDIIISGKPIIAGPQTSIPWIFLGPFFYYFLAIFLWLGKFNPLWPIYGTASFGVLAIYLVYVLGKELFDKDVGITAAFFYTISPYAILQSRIALHPSILPFFVIGFLVCLKRIISKNKNISAYYFSIIICFLISIQLHLSAVLLIPIVILNINNLLPGKIGKIDFLKIFSIGVLGVVFFKIIKNSPFTSLFFWWKIFEEIFDYGNIFGTVIALCLLIFGIVKSIKDANINSRLILISFLVMACGLTVKNSQAEHYFNLILPVIIIIFSFGFRELLKLRYGSFFAFLICLYFFISNFRSLIISQYFSNVYGPGLAKRIELAEFIVKDSENQKIILKRCGSLWDFSSTNKNYEYLVWWLSKKGRVVENKKEITYYIFEPKEALKTKEGCLEVDLNKNKLFEFSQAYLLKSN